MSHLTERLMFKMYARVINRAVFRWISDLCSPGDPNEELRVFSSLIEVT